MTRAPAGAWSLAVTTVHRTVALFRSSFKSRKVSLTIKKSATPNGITDFVCGVQKRCIFNACYELSKKKRVRTRIASRLSLVRETGLEPVRDYHTPLKRARLPIPPLSHICRSLTAKALYQNTHVLSSVFSNFFMIALYFICLWQKILYSALFKLPE